MTKKRRKRERSVITSSVMPSANSSCLASPPMFGNGSTAIDGLSGSGKGALGEAARGGSRVDADAVGVHRSRDVLDLLLAHVLEGEAQLVAHLVAHHAADADAAGLGQGFQPRGDVDAIAEDVVAVDDDVAEIDADAELDALSAGTPALRSAMPRCTSTAQRTASTTLANSTSRPSPVVLTMRPRCSAILGSISSRRCAFSGRACRPRRRP